MRAHPVVPVEPQREVRGGVLPYDRADDRPEAGGHAAHLREREDPHGPLLGRVRGAVRAVRDQCLLQAAAPPDVLVDAVAGPVHDHHDTPTQIVQVEPAAFLIVKAQRRQGEGSGAHVNGHREEACYEEARYEEADAGHSGSPVAAATRLHRFP